MVPARLPSWARDSFLISYAHRFSLIYLCLLICFLRWTKLHVRFLSACEISACRIILLVSVNVVGCFVLYLKCRLYKSHLWSSIRTLSSTFCPVLRRFVAHSRHYCCNVYFFDICFLCHYGPFTRDDRRRNC